MQATKVFQGNLMKETLENSTATVVAESAGNYAGKSFKFTGVNKTGTNKGFQVYFIDNGSGTDPTLGTYTSDSTTWRADSSSDMVSKYFTLNDGTSTTQTNYYVYFTVAGVGYDPKLGVQEQTKVVCVADSSRNLSGKYFTIKAGANASYYVWYSVSGGSNSDPAPGGTGIVVYINQNDTAYQVAYATWKALVTGANAALFTTGTAPTFVQGYQEVGLTGKTMTTATGLAASTQYYFKVTPNGGSQTEYSITTGVDTTYAAVIPLMQAASAAVCSWILIGGDLRCTSNAISGTSSISLAAGSLEPTCLQH